MTAPGAMTRLTRKKEGLQGEARWVFGEIGELVIAVHLNFALLGLAVSQTYNVATYLFMYGGYSSDRETRVCDFFMKVGSCRHGHTCTQQHPTVSPGQSRTLLISGIIPLEKAPYNVMEVAGCTGTRQLTREAQEWVDGYTEDIFLGLMQYGAICDFQMSFNSSPHLTGSVWVQYSDPREATRALEGLNKRFYAERAVSARLIQLSREIRGSRCRQYDDWLKGMGPGCRKGSDCNFVHILRPKDGLMNQLYSASNRKWNRQIEHHGESYQQRRRPDFQPRQQYSRRVPPNPSPPSSGGLWG